MTDLSLVPPIGRCLLALGGAAVASLVLLGYSIWAEVMLSKRLTDFLAANGWRTDRDEALDEAMIRDNIEHMGLLIAVGVGALAVSLLAIPVRLGYPWTRRAVWSAGIPVALAAGGMMLVERDIVDHLLPPGFGMTHYLALMAIAGAIVLACVLLNGPEAREFVNRRRQRDADPRVWQIKRRA